ncbi:lysis protein [Salmonella enterica subsp. enterica serovar Heidelberg str. CFSAN000576]|nr:lysis protein [Salmonella enterica subsp. enterica serovar Heidelberg str. CFSAN000576]
MIAHNTMTQASYSTALATALYAFLDHFTHEEWYAIGIATGVFFGMITMVANLYFGWQRNRILERQKNADQDKS